MESDPSVRFRELKNVLGAYLKTFRSEYLLAIKEYLDEIYTSNSLKELGCEEKCKECFLGFKEYNGSNPCKMWALYSALLGINIKETRNPKIVKLSKELLDSLK